MGHMNAGEMGHEAAIRAAMAEGNKHGVDSITAARIVAAYSLAMTRAEPTEAQIEAATKAVGPHVHPDSDPSEIIATVALRAARGAQ
ncbi:MAG: hypothetical protein NUV51_01885 [Sulfuricaulis sp.]|nr:hypothetical protein [Sulfuricaulis sp.]